MNSHRKKTSWRTCRDILVATIAIPVFVGLRVVPFCVIRLLTKIAGYLFWIFGWPIRRVIIANLKVAFPEWTEKERRKVGRRSLQNLFMSVGEICWMTGSPKRVRHHVFTPDNVVQRLLGHRDEERGLILVVPHFGNWEVAGIAFKEFFGRPLAAVARPFDNPYIDRLINRARTIHGNEVIPSQGAGKGMVRYLRTKGIVATLIDQNTPPRQGGVFVNFFNLPVPCSRAPAMFALKMGAPLSISGCRRVKNGVEYFFEPLSVVPETEEEITQALIDLTEKLIRSCPDQYLWFYKRYRFIDLYASEEEKKRYPFYSREVTPRFYEKNQKKSE